MPAPLVNRRLVIAGLPALAACGFEPALAPGGAQDALRGRVDISAPQDRVEFALHSELEKRLGRSAAPTFRLSYRLNLEEDGAGITPDQQITRINVVGRIAYVLRDIDTDAVLVQNSVQSFTSFATTGTTASTVFARNDANERLMAILAEMIVSDLTLRSSDWLT